MAKKLSVTDLDLKGKKALIRVDFNVPLDKQMKITDDTRIKASLPTIQYVLDHGGSTILMSHLGRPKGGPSPEFSLKPVAEHLASLLKRPVQFATDVIGTDAKQKVANLKPGEVLLLENLRFHKGEEKPSEEPEFVKTLTSFGDLYINDAFGTAHRAHASTAEIAKFFPKTSAAGFLLQKEIEFLGQSLTNPNRPFIAIIGGAKISSKLGVIRALLKKVDTLIIGGGMAYTFFKAQGYPIGNSIHEDDMVEEARSILESVKTSPEKLLLPIDTVAADKMDEQADIKIVQAKNGIPDGYSGVDIGPQSIQLFVQALRKAATVLWNGPLGVFEIGKFATGTRAIAETLTQLEATTIVGGGDSVAALQQMKLGDAVTHLSTGGGASLEYIEFGTLPGIEALTDKMD